MILIEMAYDVHRSTLFKYRKVTFYWKNEKLMTDFFSICGDYYMLLYIQVSVHLFVGTYEHIYKYIYMHICM